MEVWRMIRNMKDRGMSNREIANELGISRNTVRKMIKATKIPDPKSEMFLASLDKLKN
jgi:orotate phosphoribosyltransferase-like protein